MDGAREWAATVVITAMVGVIGFFTKSKINTIDRRLEKIEKWQGVMNVSHGEFIQLKNQIADMKEDQRAILTIVSDLRNALIRESGEERRK